MISILMAIGAHWTDALPLVVAIGMVALIMWAIPRWVISFLEGVRRGLRDGDQ